MAFCMYNYAIMIRKHKNATKKIRGVPVAQYHRVRRSVLLGEMTWDEAVAGGYVAEEAPKGRKRKPVVPVLETKRVQKVKK
jgi:hypothetical protein